MPRDRRGRARVVCGRSRSSPRPFGALRAGRRPCPGRAADPGAQARGATEAQARLDVLLAVTATLQDTELYTAGGYAASRAGARGGLDAGGTAKESGAGALRALDAGLTEHTRAPRGSAPLLTGALLLDAVDRAGARG
ncbi:triphosphoribosyl-dephospho-CoA synthase [Streptomyces sp. NPDC046832]|uniref:triphosphoribosyl-dephospho-CoA synthase n=1 Tax=Streptomyces sp. NPDC046832 TaxID=3155020 RepID=UPI003403E429